MSRIAQNTILLVLVILLLWEFSRFSQQISKHTVVSSHNTEQVVVDQNSNHILTGISDSKDFPVSDSSSEDKSNNAEIPPTIKTPVDKARIETKPPPPLPKTPPPPLPPALPALPRVVFRTTSDTVRTSQPLESPRTDYITKSTDPRTYKIVDVDKHKEWVANGQFLRKQIKETTDGKPIVKEGIILYPIEQPFSSSYNFSNSCAEGSVTYYSAVPNSRVAMAKIPIQTATRCQYATKPKEIVAGVWHCKKCEPQLLKVRETWGPRLTTVYLASAVGAQGSSFEDLLITSEPKDDYLSTLGKGLLGLKHMYEQFPNKKW